MSNYKQLYYLKNKEQIKKKVAQWKSANKSIISKRMKIYYQIHKQRILQKRKLYYNLNKEKEFQYMNLYSIKRRKTDINFKLSHSLRNRMGLALKKNFKSGKTLELLGCSIPELRNYLEKQFKCGMTWKNHSRNGWHIDHKKPCDSFDLRKPEEQQKCFHYTNLQPLWALENIRKRNK